jgi:hypothetical protein
MAEVQDRGVTIRCVIACAMIGGLIALWLLLGGQAVGASASTSATTAGIATEGDTLLLAFVAIGAFATGRTCRIAPDFPTPNHVPLSNSPAPKQSPETLSPSIVVAYSQRPLDPPRLRRPLTPPFSTRPPDDPRTQDTSPRGPPTAS